MFSWTKRHKLQQGSPAHTPSSNPCWYMIDCPWWSEHGRLLQGYGSKGIAEIPGNATLELDVELLSVKTSPFGSRVKIVEG